MLEIKLLTPNTIKSKKMKVKQKHLIFLIFQNGPNWNRILEEILETEEGYYFRKNNSGFFQVTKKDFDSAKKWTLENIGSLEVKYSQPREKQLK